MTIGATNPLLFQPEVFCICYTPIPLEPQTTVCKGPAVLEVTQGLFMEVTLLIPGLCFLLIKDHTAFHLPRDEFQKEHLSHSAKDQIFLPPQKKQSSGKKFQKNLPTHSESLI